MGFKSFRPMPYHWLFVLFAGHASATVMYQDLYLVPSYCKAHGLLMSIAFVILMPLGAFIVRGVKSERRIWIHASCQLLAWIMMIAGLVLGIRLGKIIDRLHNNVHTILGTVIVIMLLIQPFLGMIHHYRFRAIGKRTAWTIIHVWYGRFLIALGIINGGLGLQLAGNTQAGKIVYGVIAGLVGVTYYIGILVFELKGRKSNTKTTSGIALKERNHAPDLSNGSSGV